MHNHTRAVGSSQREMSTIEMHENPMSRRRRSVTRSVDHHLAQNVDGDDASDLSMSDEDDSDLDYDSSSSQSHSWETSSESGEEGEPAPSPPAPLHLNLTSSSPSATEEKGDGGRGGGWGGDGDGGVREQKAAPDYRSAGESNLTGLSPPPELTQTRVASGTDYSSRPLSRHVRHRANSHHGHTKPALSLKDKKWLASSTYRERDRAMRRKGLVLLITALVVVPLIAVVGMSLVLWTVTFRPNMEAVLSQYIDATVSLS